MRKIHCRTISNNRPLAAQTTGLEAKLQFLQDLMVAIGTGSGDVLSQYEQILNNIKFKSWVN